MKGRVLLIGTGLIGCSVALAIKHFHEATIIGYDVNVEHCKLAKSLQTIDDWTTELEAEAEQADLILLAAPVQETVNLLERLAGCKLKENAIVTDVGSTKVQIMEKAACLRERGIVFIGGHPMAGSHKTGAGSAKAHLFENAFYILTPHEDTSEQEVGKLKEWLRGTKAHFLVMDAKQHDMLTGVVSHFPHVIAASLVRQVKHHADQNELINGLAAGGFRDITRIASSNPFMWKDIVAHNKENLVELLDEWLGEMRTVRDMVANGKEDELYQYFSGAKQYRDSLPIRSKGAIPAFYDLYVDVLDRAGVISHITTLLANENISITNIRIIEAREDVFGVLRISFQTEDDRSRAKQCLERHGYETYITM
ncbi:MAG: prephenate dehydrogenase [Ectobacillus sp.]